jgi:uncharacterized protein (TIGR03067 family)
MRWSIFCAAVALLSITSRVLPAEDAKVEQTGVQGTWLVESFEAMGRKLPNPPIKQVVITADRYAYQSGRAEDKPLEFRYRLDAGKSPGEIDLMPGEGKSDVALKGIYSLQGDELKLCFPLQQKGEPLGNVRPKDFNTTDKQVMLLVVKRKP